MKFSGRRNSVINTNLRTRLRRQQRVQYVAVPGNGWERTLSQA